MTTIVSGADYLSLPRSPETWLVEPLIPVGGAALIYGDPKAGKSYAALQLALSLQAGSEWLGFHIPRPVRPIYIQLDTPRSLWADRLETLTRHGTMGIDSLLFGDLGTFDTWPFDILNPLHAELLARAVKETQADVVFIDTLRECHSGEENDSTTMKAVMSSLIAACHPAAMVLIHHSKKPSVDRNGNPVPIDLLNDARGGYIVGKMDAIVRVTGNPVGKLDFIGRSIEQDSLPLERVSDGTWKVLGTEYDHWLPSVMANGNLNSIEAKAQALADLTSRPVCLCRPQIRRAWQTS